MNNFEKTKKSFSIQAEKFKKYHMSKSEYTGYLINRINPSGNEHVLEVAAGTCICSRALSPYVKDIICQDLTTEMLNEGKRLSEEAGINNLSFIEGNAEHLPFKDAGFDIVVTRLSLHHFTNPEIQFGEMQRVLKPGGKLVIWDMEATDEALRETNDNIERMRDPSHMKILSKTEFEDLYKDKFDLIVKETTLIPVNLNSWMDLTDTPESIRKTIITKMNNDLKGKDKTGFNPYLNDGEICFDHRWLLLIGIKL